jgi:uncharacterized protein YjiS (DUF1127 family)
MSATDRPTPSGRVGAPAARSDGKPARPRSWLVTLFNHLLEAHRERRRRRRQGAALSALSDYMLEDLGLSRSELRAAEDGILPSAQALHAERLRPACQEPEHLEVRWLARDRPKSHRSAAIGRPIPGGHPRPFV